MIDTNTTPRVRATARTLLVSALLGGATFAGVIGALSMLLDAPTAATLAQTTPEHPLAATSGTSATALLTVVTGGTGSGTVTPSPAGTGTGGTTYTTGTAVTLTATPAAGSYFAGWVNCGSTTTSTTCQLTLNNDTSVTALFTARIPLRTGNIFSSAQAGAYSFLRFFNTGTAAGTATVTLRNGDTGVVVGTWTSPSIPANGEAQYPISTVESGLNAGVAKPQFYTIDISTGGMSGYFQHVLFLPSFGTLTNLSNCGSPTAVDTAQVSAVHSSLLSAGYPSTIILRSNASTSQTVTLDVYDAAAGTKIGTFTTAAIAPYAQLQLSTANIETALGKVASAGQFHYVVKVTSSFTGYLQHVVNNMSVGVTTDMTAGCSLSGT
jgi:hypothetical protein